MIYDGLDTLGDPDSGTLDPNVEKGLNAEVIKPGLLHSLWFNGNDTVAVVWNPSVGGGTNTVGDRFGDPIAQVAPAMLPRRTGDMAQQNWTQMAELIGHELAHAELPNAYNNCGTAANPTQAVAIGERDVASAYTTQYGIATQLGDAQDQNMSGLVGGKLLSTLKGDSTGVDISSLSSPGALAGSLLFLAAVGRAS